ncbi:MAG TPA: NYN domain-containing protein [Caulobacteraceae bacterium]
MTFYPTERLALFIDGANLYSSAKGLGFDIDYKRLLEEFRARGVLVRAYYYTALVEEQDYSPIRPLVDWLDYNGFTLVTKTAREYTDSQGRKRWRGDMDVDLAVDMMEITDRVDHVVLFSGDGDFRRLVEAVQRRGVRVTVVSTVKSQPPMASDDLRRQADVFIDLADLSEIIGRPARLPRVIQEAKATARAVREHHHGARPEMRQDDVHQEADAED